VEITSLIFFLLLRLCQYLIEPNVKLAEEMTGSRHGLAKGTFARRNWWWPRI